MSKLAVITAIIVVIFAFCKGNPIKGILEAFKDAPLKEQFKVYHHIYKKDYELNSEEGIRRYKIFKENVKEINEINAKKLTYRFRINQFTDMTKEEFLQKYAIDPQFGSKMMRDSMRFLEEEKGYFDAHADEEIVVPAMTRTPIDHKKYLNPPREQGGCGSCWTFATTASLESSMGKKLKIRYPYLSTQQFLDCDKYDGGCSGGNSWNIKKYVLTTGIIKEDDYPYKGEVGECLLPTYIADTVRAKSHLFCDGYPTKCTADLIYAQLQTGCTAVSIDSSAIRGYGEGIFYSDNCNWPNHLVALCGYGKEIDGREYWLIRNSWGPYWGEEGYIRVGFDPKNQSCLTERESYQYLV